MTTKSLVPIVEGQSEERSAGGLLRRYVHRENRFDVSVARPVRVKRNQVVRDGEVERVIKLALRSREHVAGIVLILDADDDCPVEVARDLLNRAVAVTVVPVAVVVAHVETESWILAGIESVRGVRGIADDAEPPMVIENVRDAKGALTKRMTGSRGYVPTADQPALLESLDLDLAEQRSPSLRKLRRDIVRLLAAID